jgi:hypothetical protein
MKLMVRFLQIYIFKDEKHQEMTEQLVFDRMGGM